MPRQLVRSLALRSGIADLTDVAPASLALALMILWAAHDGGYDADTWYWGALVLLGLLVVQVVVSGARLRTLPRPMKLALAAFGAYVAWSYLSISWAGYAGDALTGSNRALMYLAVFAIFALTRWTPQRALVLLTAYALAVGVLGLLVLIHMATGHNVHSLFSQGRLISPTGYFNSSAALFTAASFVAVGLSVRKELPPLVRGALIAAACAGIQLSLLAESRGWLFTLPLMLLAGLAVTRERLRTSAAALLPIIATVAPLSPLLHVFKSTQGTNPTASALAHAAEHAGRTCLVICAVMFVVATVIALADTRFSRQLLSPPRQRLLGAVAAALAILVAASGALAATHGHPVPFIKRQWNGFTHPSTGESNSSGSHFSVVGSGRYDAWRVSLDALGAHPLGGLGQDNFADYYIRHRRTLEELQWTHSLEFRLLAHTGLVGFALFAVFIVSGLLAALRNRRRETMLTAALVGTALLPLIVWLIHGSVDWFWEMPALSGPALGFFALAGACGAPVQIAQATPVSERIPAAVPRVIGLLAVVAGAVVLGFPYLSVREVSTANDLRAKNPVAALDDLSLAAKLNPLSADPARLAGTIALQSGRFNVAKQRFSQAIDREPGGWFAWLGRGLAASTLGDVAYAHYNFAVARSINSHQQAVIQALARVETQNPLTIPEAFQLLILVQ